jgi:hypothetical protein
MTEYPLHFKAKQFMFHMLERFKPGTIAMEYVYHNPNNIENDPRWEWKFDVYAEIGDRKIAVEIDDHKGHYSRKNHFQSKENIAKRKFKINYLKEKGIELYAWARKDIIGKNSLEPYLFLEEMKLV